MLVSDSITVILSSLSWFITLGVWSHPPFLYNVTTLLHVLCQTGLLPASAHPARVWLLSKAGSSGPFPFVCRSLCYPVCLCLWVLGSLVSPFYLLSHLIYKVRGQRSNLAKAKRPDLSTSHTSLACSQKPAQISLACVCSPMGISEYSQRGLVNEETIFPW